MDPFNAVLLGATLIAVAPLLLAAAGELVAERAGVINIGLEGMMLAGAFTSVVVASATGSPLLGLAGGAAGGIAFGVIMAVLAVDVAANQILVGVGINILAFGLTSFLNESLFSSGEAHTAPTLNDISVPGLSSLGGVGHALFSQNIGVYLSFAAIIVVAVAIYRTDWGIALRAVGENAAAADAAGVSVRGTQWTATLIAAGLAGLGGAQLAIGGVGTFTNGMTAGRGFLALAAVLFGAWRPTGVLLGCLVFASVDALQLSLQGLPSVPASVWFVAATLTILFIVSRVWRARDGRDIGRVEIAAGVVTLGTFVVLTVVSPRMTIPPTFWLASPFLLALVVLATVGERGAAAPSMLGIPYVRSET